MGLFGPPNIEKLKAKRDVKGLVKALRYPKDTSVCKKAAEALGELGDIGAVKPLIIALKDVEIDVRKAAVEALAQIADIRTVQPLIEILQDVNNSLQRAAAEALGQIGDAHAIDPLITALKAIDPTLRKVAADSLEKIGAPAVESLIAALKNIDSSVREAAAITLDKIGWRPGKEESAVAYWVAKREWEKCKKIGAPAVTTLVGLLKDESTEIREAAVSALGCIADHGVVDPLIATLSDTSKQVRRAAADSLVTLYKSDVLDKTYKDRILTHRGIITSEHVDKKDHDDGFNGSIGESDCRHSDWSHTDKEGIGVAFPV